MGAARARQDALRAVEAYAAANPDLGMQQVADGRWYVQLSGEHKRAVPVSLDVGEHQLSVQSFFMRAPDENDAALYAYLLRRHTRSYVLRFALTDDGDVLLLGAVPHAAVDATELDRLLGQVLAVADESFTQALRLGFASYIEREQAWRAKVGAPRNPVT